MKEKFVKKLQNQKRSGVTNICAHLLPIESIVV